MPASSQAQKILIVEDNPGDFILIEDYLKEEFMHPEINHVITFGQAKAYLSKEHELNAILLDLSLPDAGGESLVTEMVKLAGSTPVIVLTGYSDKDFGVKALALGVSDYLLKDELISSQLYKSLVYAIERKRISLKLNESEEKYRYLFQLSPLPMWVVDTESLHFLNVNDAAVRHYGFSRADFLVMTIDDIKPPEESNNIVRSAKYRSNNYFNDLETHRKKNGDLINVSITSNPIEFNGKMGQLILAADVTEKLKAEQALTTSEQRFKALVQDGSDLINIVDKAGRYKYRSPASEAFMGIPADQLNGKSVFDFIHEGDRDRIVKQFNLLLTQKRARTLPYRFKGNSNEYRWLESIGTNMLDDPSIEGIIINSRDITESINHLQAIEAHNLKLQEIAWIQSHIVRAPLTRIMGLVHLLHNYPNEKDTAELLKHLATSANELDEVIRSIVDRTDGAPSTE